MPDAEKSLQDFAHGATFQEPSVVAAYKFRPDYGVDVFDFRASLIPSVMRDSRE